MNRLLFWFVLLAAMIIVVLFLIGRGTKHKFAANSFETNAPPAATTVPSAPAPTQVQSNSQMTSIATNSVVTPQPTKGDLMKQGLSQMNDVPIIFYGRLEDQYNAPVEGAQIAASVRIYNGAGSTTTHLATVSDGNGMFQINGGKGESLAMMPKKSGYVLATTNTLFKYSYMYSDHFSSDPNNPTVLKMWKLQGAESLAQINCTFKIPYTASPISFDLISGQIVPSGGDLTITVNRPNGIISQQNPQNWSVDLAFTDGGYISTSPDEAAITYAAPEGFYQPSGTFENNNGPRLIDEMLFAQSRHGQIYSKFHLLFGINSTSEKAMTITFSGVANTNGSRNWEATAPK